MGVVDFSEIPDAWTTFEGLTHPNWRAFQAQIDRHLPKERWADAWSEVIREWLDRLSRNFGHSYATMESSRCFLLMPGTTRARTETMRFCECSIGQFERILPDPNVELYGKRIAILTENSEDYYRYICHYYPEGVVPPSGGVFLSRGYAHVVVQGWNWPGTFHTLLHELIHTFLCFLRIPTWLNEGVACYLPELLLGETSTLTREQVASHHARWKAQGLERFWGGEALRSKEEEEALLAYSLAETLVRILVADHATKIRDFIRDAGIADAGEASAREHLGTGLGELAGIFLGPGDWTPRGRYDTGAGLKRR